MEQNFQTSFIPKKPIIDERATSPRPVGLLTLIAVLLFFTMLISTGVLYFYKVVLTKSITTKENDLILAKDRFEPTKISQLQVLDKRLRASNEILSKHIAISPIFSVLQDITMKTVRYTKFSYDMDSAKSGMVTIKLGGMAIGYRSVALQSDLFTQNKNLIDPVFSNLSLDESGNVIFDLEFSVASSFVDYQEVLKIESTNSINTPNPPPDTIIFPEDTTTIPDINPPQGDTNIILN